jgi:hypothetical protein
MWMTEVEWQITKKLRLSQCREADLSSERRGNATDIKSEGLTRLTLKTHAGMPWQSSLID